MWRGVGSFGGGAFVFVYAYIIRCGVVLVGFGGGALVLRLLFAVLFSVVVVCCFAFLCLLLNLLCFLCVVS